MNCYKGGGESVGYHSDQLTYLGPRAVIGSLSLGVGREFRVRKIVARDDDGNGGGKDPQGHNLRADAEGQISIHLPHNSLLVMHAEMQEEWKHSIHPASAIDPHPISGNKRINITYRYYRESFHPRFEVVCYFDSWYYLLIMENSDIRLAVNVTLRLCCDASRERRKIEGDTCGRAMWAISLGKKGKFFSCALTRLSRVISCKFFQWAEFDDDGEPPWAKKETQPE